MVENKDLALAATLLTALVKGQHSRNKVLLIMHSSTLQVFPALKLVGSLWR